jgi:hypothetical protein
MAAFAIILFDMSPNTKKRAAARHIFGGELVTKPAAVDAYIGGKGFGCKLVIVARADIPTEFDVFLRHIFAILPFARVFSPWHKRCYYRWKPHC